MAKAAKKKTSIVPTFKFGGGIVRQLTKRDLRQQERNLKSLNLAGYR